MNCPPARWLGIRCDAMHDAAFLVLEFLDSVRGVDSRKIDVLWREFFASAHTGSAHKTQYVGMAILRAFWGQALEPDLDALYHAMRCIPSAPTTAAASAGIGRASCSTAPSSRTSIRVDARERGADTEVHLQLGAARDGAAAHARRAVHQPRRVLLLLARTSSSSKSRRPSLGREACARRRACVVRELAACRRRTGSGGGEGNG